MGRGKGTREGGKEGETNPSLVLLKLVRSS